VRHAKAGHRTHATPLTRGQHAGDTSHSTLAIPLPTDEGSSARCGPQPSASWGRASRATSSGNGQPPTPLASAWAAAWAAAWPHPAIQRRSEVAPARNILCVCIRSAADSGSQAAGCVLYLVVVPAWKLRGHSISVDITLCTQHYFCRVLYDNIFNALDMQSRRILVP